MSRGRAPKTTASLLQYSAWSVHSIKGRNSWWVQRSYFEFHTLQIQRWFWLAEKWALHKLPRPWKPQYGCRLLNQQKHENPAATRQNQCRCKADDNMHGNWSCSFYWHVGTNSGVRKKSIDLNVLWSSQQRVVILLRRVLDAVFCRVGFRQPLACCLLKRSSNRIETLECNIRVWQTPVISLEVLFEKVC